jgi:hypothetical protein
MTEAQLSTIPRFMLLNFAAINGTDAATKVVRCSRSLSSKDAIRQHEVHHTINQFSMTYIMLMGQRFGGDATECRRQKCA